MRMLNSKHNIRNRPHNIIFMIIGLFVPWQFFATYYECDGSKMIFSRYYAKDEKMRKNKIEFDIDDVIKIGFPKDLEISIQEEKLKGVYGVYISQEINFILKNGDIISFNARPYSKKQCRELITIFSCVKGELLSKALGL